MPGSNTSRAGSQDDTNDVREEEPLLGNSPNISLANSEAEPSIRAARSLSTLILYFMTLHFLLGTAEMILVAPLIRLFENSLCLKHYGFPDGGVAEALCKIPEIQGPLATIRGWKSMFDSLPGIL